MEYLQFKYYFLKCIFWKFIIFMVLYIHLLLFSKIYQVKEGKLFINYWQYKWIKRLISQFISRHNHLWIYSFELDLKLTLQHLVSLLLQLYFEFCQFNPAILLDFLLYICELYQKFYQDKLQHMSFYGLS